MEGSTKPISRPTRVGKTMRGNAGHSLANKAISVTMGDKVVPNKAI